ncbi:endonuclease domain-containing protein [Sphingomonas sp. BGYR3]|uniref:endonuclease domain-containing protein n=1 Tax=Sphingomonas sp. BGYR3 TaxID=2975483 RepID=UPI0021A2C204|nr:endonuclease domain-containing protein [Sphingomonas sp. BGYR3]
MHDLRNRAREMRLNPTEWEKRLWRRLSNSQTGHKFRRQAVIAPFICDFFCPAKALIVEIDGDTHDPAADARRDQMLAGQGYRTMRFTNADVRDNIEGVLQTIVTTLARTPDRWPGHPHPDSSPEGEGPTVPQAKPLPFRGGVGVGEPGDRASGNPSC